jgi:ketosteroid isomerase-like protein
MRDNPDYQRILELHNLWIEAELRGDIQSMLRICSEEIRFYPPDSAPVEGKSAVSVLLQSDQQNIERIEIKDLLIEVSGNLAYKTASFATHVQSEPSLYEGNHLWILRREEFDWRILIVSWSVT